jgi:thiol-disulfide isomerase/thioredoxin
MQKIIFIVALLVCHFVNAQTIPAIKEKNLYGIVHQDSLLQDPFKKWFKPNYTDYHPNAELMAALKKLNLKDVTVKIFFGSWCGDSKREVPRFYKVMDSMGFNTKNIQLIALGNSDSLNKKSPTGEEKGLGIFRVPVFIFLKNGKEINRINEYPAFSLEKDIEQILNKKTYTPSYASFSTINNWLLDGTLNNENNNNSGLANELRNKVSGENELNSVGYLLLNNGLKKEALKIFKINYQLFSSSTNVMSSLGEGFLKNNEKQKAIVFLEKALKENKDQEAFNEILQLLYDAKGLK